MQYDQRGIAVTTHSRAAVRHLDRAVTGLLAHRSDTTEHIAAALSADPNLTTAHCLAGFACLLLGRSELFAGVERSLAMARTSLAFRGGTARERMLTEALAAWYDGEMELAANRLDETLVANPLDALTAKLVQSVRFMLGDASGMRRSVERILPAWSEEVPGYGFILGCHAFALEETGALASAEWIGQCALAQEPLDVWGCHAVTHVHEMRGDTAQGLAWTALHVGRWREVNNFARHMAWHQALFLLACHETDAVLDLYDRELREVKSDDYRDITNAASLLYHLEARGIAVGRRWTELADLAECRLTDHALAFAQLHYLLCLVGDGRWEAAYRLIAAMDLEAKGGHGTQARILAEIGVPLAKTMLAVLGGDRPVAVALPHRRDLARLGGSGAQRQTFERILRQAENRRRPPEKRVVTALGNALHAAQRPSPIPASFAGLALAR